MNIPMKVRQERLGHMEAKTTMGYTHLVSADDRLLSERLGDILCPNVPKLDVKGSKESLEVLTIQ